MELLFNKEIKTLIITFLNTFVDSANLELYLVESTRCN